MKTRFFLPVIVTMFSFLLSSQAFSYIYEVKVLRSSGQGGDRYVIGLSDYHDKQHPLNEGQQKAITRILNTCSRSDTKVLLEDLSSQGYGGKVSCGSYYVDSRGGILGGLAQWAVEKGFEVDNAEFRYCRVASLGPVLNDSTQDPRTMGSVSSISLADIRQEIDAVASDIQSYKDGNVLEHVYTQGIDTLRQELKNLGIVDDGSLSVADYVYKRAKSADNRLDLVKNLLTFDSGLLDLLMVHSALHTDKKQVVVVAGGAHIDRIAELLKKAGYETVYETDVAFSNEYNLDRCLGSNIVEGEYCVHPEPIDLSVVEKYLR